MEQIKSLSDTSLDALFAAREEAFRDYELTLDKKAFAKMLHRRGYVPELSFGAFDQHRLVSFTLNGVGFFDGRRTVYDTGTGTLPEYRGRGLASAIFTASLPALKQAGIEQYLLEVLQHNTKAISVYTKLGFKITKEFNYFIEEDANAMQANAKLLPSAINLREVNLINHEMMMAMWDFIPSWQNNFEAISKTLTDFKVIGAFDNQILVGYGIIEPDSGDIPQLAVDQLYRRKGIGSAILKRVAEL